MRRYDPKITTPPGLYVLAAPYAIAVAGDPNCRAHALRSINVLFQTGSFILLIATCRALAPREKPSEVMRGRLRASLVGAALATSPVHCFTGFLFYTDPASTFFVLLVHLLTVSGHRRGGSLMTSSSYVKMFLRHVCTAFASIFAIACRQNNVVWVAFCMGVQVLNFVETGEGRKISSATSSSRSTGSSRRSSSTTNTTTTVRSLSGECRRLANCLVTRRWVFRVLLHPAAVSSVWPFLAAIAVFVYSYVKNGYAVVLGDKSNHVPVLHLCQLLYFAIITGSVFSLDWFVSKKHSVLSVLRDMFWAKQYTWTHAMSSALFVAACALAVRFANPTHRFMLADNRHYIFYIWRKTGLANKKDGVAQYLVTPIYAMVWWGMLRRLRAPAPAALRAPTSLVGGTKKREAGMLAQTADPLRSWFWILGFLLCTALILVPAHLVEFRYFIIPSLLVQIHMLSAHSVTASRNGDRAAAIRGAVPIGSLCFTLVLHLVVNAATVYVFVSRGFQAPDGSFSRFMW
jgi:alpha-1,2-glucosyltransferase